MKKRFFSLALCAIMVFSAFVFSACTEKEYMTVHIGSEAKAMTITLYSIVEEGTTDKAIQAVQDAINEITEYEFNTHIVLKFYEEDEYYDVIEQRIVEIEKQMELEEKLEDAKKVAQKAIKGVGFTTAAEETDETAEETDETEFNNYGLVETVYPDVKEEQLDIFLINNVETYTDFAKRGLLASLDEELSINSKILSDYIYPTLMSSAKVGTTTYGIPNNHVIGEYTYLLVNRELADKYSFHPDNLTTISSLDSTGYLQDIINLEPTVTPMVGDFFVNVAYPCMENPIIGSVISASADGTAQTNPKILLSTVQSYRNALSLQYKYKQYISHGDLSDYGKVGAAVVTGSYLDGKAYEDDYYVSVLQKPTVTNEEVYSSMYAVSTYATSVKRCMEIIELFTTDDRIINIMSYGVEGINYRFKDKNSDVIEILSKDPSHDYYYSVNPLYMGNQYKQYITTDSSDTTIAMAENDWAAAKSQNLDSVMNPYVGFVLDLTEPEPEDEEEVKTPSTPATPATGTGETATGTDEPVVKKEYLPIAELMEEFVKLFDGVESRVNNYNGSADDYSDYLESIGFELSENEIISQLMDAANPSSIASQYKKFFDARNTGNGTTTVTE